MSAKPRTRAEWQPPDIFGIAFPWDAEPDHMDETSPEGYPCLLRRGPLGSWCGYVGVPKDHPLFGKEYSDTLRAPPKFYEETVNEKNSPIDLITAAFTYQKSKGELVDVGTLFNVHGGITWTNDHAGGAEPNPEGMWWFGFDCSHAGDLTPGLIRALHKIGYKVLPEHHMPPHETYREPLYVLAECRSLASQLKAYADAVEASA